MFDEVSQRKHSMVSGASIHEESQTGKALKQYISLGKHENVLQTDVQLVCQTMQG